jgi:hypothetical protein
MRSSTVLIAALAAVSNAAIATPTVDEPTEIYKREPQGGQRHVQSNYPVKYSSKLLHYNTPISGKI